jgi:hypothetical protein
MDAAKALLMMGGLAAILVGCQSVQMQPYVPTREGVSISGSASTGYRVDSVSWKRAGVTASPEALEFCYGQNVPSLSGQPLFNPSKTRVTAQGRDQVSFIVPMTMGTPLNFELFFSVTSGISNDVLTFEYRNLKIKGTWTANEAPLPASQQANLYVEGALDKLESITNSVTNCVLQES